VIFVLSLLLLSTASCFCCCWPPWSPAVAYFLAVDCFPSGAGTIADDPFLLAFFIMASLLLLSCLLLLLPLLVLAVARLPIRSFLSVFLLIPVGK
jgi:hypothetical protein